jgi:hypothetical protein
MAFTGVRFVDHALCDVPHAHPELPRYLQPSSALGYLGAMLVRALGAHVVGSLRAVDTLGVDEGAASRVHDALAAAFVGAFAGGEAGRGGGGVPCPRPFREALLSLMCTVPPTALTPGLKFVAGCLPVFRVYPDPGSPLGKPSRPLPFLVDVVMLYLYGLIGDG